MRLLLDTHVLLRALTEPDQLSTATVSALEDGSNTVFVSAVTIWEVAIKAGLGKVEADAGELAAEAVQIGFSELPVRLAHSVRVQDLPPHHRDPFDRLLIAQAQEEDLIVVTRDRQFAAYDVATLQA